MNWNKSNNNLFLHRISFRRIQHYGPGFIDAIRTSYSTLKQSQVWPIKAKAKVYQRPCPISPWSSCFAFTITSFFFALYLKIAQCDLFRVLREQVTMHLKAIIKCPSSCVSWKMILFAHRTVRHLRGEPRLHQEKPWTGSQICYSVII